MSDISGLINQFPYAGLFILLILGGIGFPFPEDATIILSGFLVANNIVKPVPAFLVVYPGLLITDFILYSFGRKYGRMVVTHKRFHKIISPKSLSLLEDKFKKSGNLVVFFGRHIIGLRAQIFLVAGIMRMAPLKFLAVDATSAIFTIALMGGIGYVGGHSLYIIRRDITKIEHIAILVIVLLITIYLILKYFMYGKDKT